MKTLIYLTICPTLSVLCDSTLRLWWFRRPHDLLDQFLLHSEFFERLLEMLGDDEADRLGIKYNLGLAYELAGDYEKAKSQFEDVYVSDVTFRDVAKKIQQYS